MRIAVIGAGVLGLLTARSLLKAGVDVDIYDRSKAGREASWAGGGIIFPLCPWDEPEKNVPLFINANKDYASLTEALKRSTGINPEYQQHGYKLLDVQNIDKAVAWCDSNGVTCLVEKNNLFLPEVGSVRNPRLLKSIVVSIKEKVSLFEGYEVTQGEINSLNINDCRYDRVIVCAGAWASDLLVNYAIPKISPVKGEMLLCRADESLKHITIKNGVYLIPRQGNQFLIGSTLDYAGFDKSITESAKGFLLEAARAICPEARNVEVVQQWAGLRPGIDRDSPVISALPENPAIILNGGHYRSGLTMAPVSASLAASLALGHQVPSFAQSYKV